MIKRRVIMVDDHFLARDELKYLLRTNHPDMDIVAEFEDIESAWGKIAAGEVDGVFLDINFEQQGENAGLTLARRIKLLAVAPWIIFVTGYPEHALEAHDFRPFGYIVKPIDEAKLEKVLNKVRETIPVVRSPIRIEVRHKIIRLDEKNNVERLFLNRFLVPDEILYIQSNSGTNAVKVHLVNDEVLEDVNIRLNNWLMDYDLPGFQQIRRNTLANLKYVSGYKPDPERAESFLLTFKNIPIELAIGANFFVAFKEAIKKCL
ncbi:MAG: LytTR family DNA-binding domain-containing protein [Methylococcales bacterium]